MLGLVLVGVALFAAGSLWASVGGDKRSAAAEYQYPTVDLTAGPNPINVGQTSTLTWSTTDVTSCTAYGDWSGSKALNGSQVVSPWGWDKGFYELYCTGPDGDAARGMQVIVRQPLTFRAVLDQQRQNAYDEEFHARIGQTFTVGITGWLTDIGLFGTGENAFDQVAVTRTAPDGSPGAVLTSTTVSKQASIGTVRLPKRVFVIAGQHLAVTLTAPSYGPDDDVYWLYVCNDPDLYPRGDSYSSDALSGGWTKAPGCDNVFRTYVVRRVQQGP